MVAAPAVGAIALSQWTAHHLTPLRFIHSNRYQPEVVAVYAEPDDTVLCESETGDFSTTISISKHPDVVLPAGGKVIMRRPGFVLKRGYKDDVFGKRVLVVEDTLTTGRSALQTVRAVTSAGGRVVGLGVLVNGGNVTPQMCGVDRLEALMTVNRKIFTEEDCLARGLCAEGVPIDIDHGHGKAFLVRKGMAQL